MKKIIALFAALSVCALMLAGCGDTGITESVTAEQTEEANNAAADDSSANGEAEADTSGSSEAAASYASLDEFFNADDIFDHPAESVDRDNTYSNSINQSFEGATDIYIDLESPDGNMKITAAMSMETKQLLLNIENLAYTESDITNASIIMTDGRMYILEPSSKLGLYMDIDEEQFAQMFDQYNAEKILAESEIEITSIDLDNIMSYGVEIGGRSYTFEFSEKIGALFDENGNYSAVVNGDPDAEIHAAIINEFSDNIPSGAFDVPPDYKIMDMADLDENIPKASGSSYASIDDFVSAKNVLDHPAEPMKIESSKSYELAQMIKNNADLHISIILYGGGKNYMDVSISGNDLSADVKLSDNSGYSTKIVDGVCYTFTDDSDIIISSHNEEEVADAYDTHDLRDVFETLEHYLEMSFYEVGIDGKTYTFEIGLDEDGDTTGCLFDPDGKLCAAVQRVDDRDTAILVSDFSANIPSGAFDIPTGYRIFDKVDLE